MQFFKTSFALLLAAALSSCSASRVEQCKALTSAKTPQISQEPSSEELIAAHKTALEGYRKLWLNDQELKQLRDKQINLLERQISLSEQFIEIENKSKTSPGNPNLLQQAIQQSQKQIEISKESMELIKESERLCPSTEKQK